MAQRMPVQANTGCDERFENLARLIPQGCLVVFPDGVVCFSNDIVQQQFHIFPGDYFDIPAYHDYNESETYSINVRVKHSTADSDTLAVDMRMTRTTWNDETAYLVILDEAHEAKTGEDELHEQAIDRHRAVLERQNTLIFRFRPDTILTYANAACCSFTGRNREELVGSSILNFIPRSNHEALFRHINSIQRSQRMIIIELPVIVAGGEIRWLQVTDQVIPDQDGNVLEVQSVGRDITQRKLAETSLIESEARYRGLIEDSPALICRFRPDGKLVYVNETLCNHMELERSELLGSSFYDLMVEERRHSTRAILEHPLPEMRRITVEGQAMTASGRVCWTRWTNRPIFDADGRLIEYQAVGIDITQSKTAEDALRASEARFRDLLENLQLVAILLSLDGSVLYVNEFFTRLTGFPPEEILGRNWFETIVPAEDRERVLKSFHIMATEGRLIPHGSNNILTVHGERRLISWNTTFLRDPQGQIVGISSIGEDITERTWAQQLQAVVQRISQGTVSCETVEELYALIHDSLKQVMQVSNFFISVFDVTEQKLTFPYYIDQYDEPPEPQPLGRGLTDYVLRTGKPLLASPEVFEDLINRGEVEEVGAPSVDWIGVPLKNGQGVFGVMVAQSYTEGVRFTQRELHVLDFVSTQIANTIERKRAEQALRDNEEKYRALVEASSSAVFLETYDGDILECNSTACRLLGYSREELVCLHVSDLLPEHLAANLKQMVAENIDNGRNTWETVNRRKDGTIFPVQVTTRPVTIGGQALSVVFVDDLSQRRQHEREMEAIAGVSAALRTAITQADILPVILEQLLDRLQVHGAFITLLDGKHNCPRIVQGCGTWSMLADRDLPQGDSLCCQVINTGQMYLNNQAAEDPGFPFPELIDGVKAIASVPLVTQGDVFGALTVGYEHPIQQEEIHILVAISNIAASAIQRARLFDQTSQQATELSAAYDATIEGWALALELRDKETQGHSRRVSDLTTRLALKMGMDEESLVHLRRGVLLHDIGKMGIPDRILLKSEALTDEEWVLMRMHPEYAYRMLASISYLKPALDIPYCHHERWDGTGYPRGLKGEEIPLAARIFAVVDVMDALTSDRPYRPAWPKEEALQYIRRQSGRHFDPAVIEAFLSLME